MEEIEKENNDLKTQLNSNKDSVSQEKFSNLQKEKFALEDQNKSLSAQIESLKANIDKCNTDLNVQADLSENLNKIIDEKNKEIQEKNDKIEEYNKIFLNLQNLNILQKNGEKTEDPITQLDDIDELLSSHRDSHSQEVESLIKLITACKDALILEREKNESLLQDIEQYKSVNNQLLQKNEELKQNPSSSVQEKDEDEVNGLKLQVTELQKLIVEKENEIDALKSPNPNVSLHTSTETSVSNLRTLPLEEIEKKIKKYKTEIRKRDMDIDAERQQSAILKTQIKELNSTIKSMQSFENKIKNYDEFSGLFKTAFDGYKPKKKEQEEAYNKIKEHLSGYVKEDEKKKK